MESRSKGEENSEIWTAYYYIELTPNVIEIDEIKNKRLVEFESYFCYEKIMIRCIRIILLI